MPDIPSRDVLKGAVNEILRTHDLEKITLRMVMSMLSEGFSVPPADLAPQKRFVRETINEFLESSYDPPAPETSAAPVPAAKKRKSAAATPSSSAELKPVRLTGLERAVVLAEPLADFFGVVVIPRSQIPKRISAYAKEHRLQDPADGRKILCDDALKTALNVEHFTFFSLAKLVSGLVYKPEECDEELQALAKECEEKYLAEKTRKREEDLANGIVKPSKPRAPAKKQKVAQKAAAPTQTRKPSGLLKPMQLSDALTAVCGQSQLPRSEVLKKIWMYIRENQLKDPNNSTRILCDDKLQAVFDGNTSVANMGINKFLSAHMTKID